MRLADAQYPINWQENMFRHALIFLGDKTFVSWQCGDCPKSVLPLLPKKNTKISYFSYFYFLKQKKEHFFKILFCNIGYRKIFEP